MSELEKLENRFKFHPANTEDKAALHEHIRARCLELAKTFHFNLPPGREQALALTKVEEAMFWANAAIARTGS